MPAERRTAAVQLRTTALLHGIGTCARRPIDRPLPAPDQRQADGRAASAARYLTLSIGPRSWPPRRRTPTQTNPATTRTRASVPPLLRRAPILRASASARFAVARSYSSEASRCARVCTSRTFHRRSARRPHLDCAPQLLRPAKVQLPTGLLAKCVLECRFASEGPVR
jgi:hypothetical protein